MQELIITEELTPNLHEQFLLYRYKILIENEIRENSNNTNNNANSKSD